jgi:hypothetical protein
MTSVIQSDGTIIFIPFPQESAEEEYAVQRMMEDGAGALRPGGMG